MTRLGDAIRDRAVIVGIGETEFRRKIGRSERQIACEAILAALRDAAIEPAEVDGVVYCNETGHSFERVSGRGRIWSFIVAHPPLPPGFAKRVPMPVALVELDEDPAIRVVAEIVPGTDPARVSIGAAVEAVFERVTDELTLARWRLV